MTTETQADALAIKAYVADLLPQTGPRRGSSAWRLDRDVQAAIDRAAALTGQPKSRIINEILRRALASPTASSGEGPKTR